MSDPIRSSTAQEKGERLTQLRSLSGLSLVEIASRSNIGYSTLRQWKSGHRSMTLTGAKKIADVVREEGIVCSPQWLMIGEGEPPAYVNPSQQMMNEAMIVQQEIQYFLTQHEASVVFTMTERVLRPYIAVGDFVGGICLDEADFHQADQSICVVYPVAGDPFCRWTQQLPEQDIFHFTGLNVGLEAVPTITLSSKDIDRLAPLARVWKKADETSKSSRKKATELKERE